MEGLVSQTVVFPLLPGKTPCRQWLADKKWAALYCISIIQWPSHNQNQREKTKKTRQIFHQILSRDMEAFLKTGKVGANPGGSSSKPASKTKGEKKQGPVGHLIKLSAVKSKATSIQSVIRDEERKVWVWEPAEVSSALLCFPYPTHVMLSAEELEHPLMPTIQVPWVEKYRPRTITDVAHQDEVSFRLPLALFYLLTQGCGRTQKVFGGKRPTQSSFLWTSWHWLVSSNRSYGFHLWLSRSWLFSAMIILWMISC